MARQPKRPEVPETYLCAYCVRRLLVDNYSVALPKDVPPERVHQVTEPMMPAFTLGCTCGHYTVVSPWREQNHH